MQSYCWKRILSCPIAHGVHTVRRWFHVCRLRVVAQRCALFRTGTCVCCVSFGTVLWSSHQMTNAANVENARVWTLFILLAQCALSKTHKTNHILAAIVLVENVLILTWLETAATIFRQVISLPTSTCVIKRSVYTEALVFASAVVERARVDICTKNKQLRRSPSSPATR